MASNANATDSHSQQGAAPQICSVFIIAGFAFYCIIAWITYPLLVCLFFVTATIFHLTNVCQICFRTQRNSCWQLIVLKQIAPLCNLCVCIAALINGIFGGIGYCAAHAVLCSGKRLICGAVFVVRVVEYGLFKLCGKEAACVACTLNCTMKLEEGFSTSKVFMLKAEPTPTTSSVLQLGQSKT